MGENLMPGTGSPLGKPARNAGQTAQALGPDSPEWTRLCVTSPQDGVVSFLTMLQDLSGAPFSHLRTVSRLGRYYQMVDGIGPYKDIGWQRRFRLLDGKSPASLAYQLIPYRQTADCRTLEEKYSTNPEVHEFLSNLTYGYWIPLCCGQVELGYVTLSWDHSQVDSERLTSVHQYVQSHAQHLGLLFYACRSTLATRFLGQLWESCATILTAPAETHCYEQIASACTQLWGSDCTSYVGMSDPHRRYTEVVAVSGQHAADARKARSKTRVPWHRGLFGFAAASKQAVRSDSFSDDRRFAYHSMRRRGENAGSGIAMSLRSHVDATPLGVLSVEHDRPGYFDDDDLRYLTGLGRIAHSALAAHRSAAGRLAREIDSLFTQMAHDVFEPLQALVADADVLRSEAGTAPSMDSEPQALAEHMDGIALRAGNVLDTCIEIDSQVRRILDAGVDGASSRDVSGRANLYRTLVALLNTWEERASSRFIELTPLFDALRGVHVQCDESELKAILGHLLGNAIKYSFAGRPGAKGDAARQVVIVGRVSLRMACIQIHNLGVGILPSELETVKEKFYRGELAKKEGRAGTGRGLWSADRFVTGVGGWIKIHSVPVSWRRGREQRLYRTVVKVYLPVVEEK